jgi:hypothetical protein
MASRLLDVGDGTLWDRHAEIFVHYLDMAESEFHGEYGQTGRFQQEKRHMILKWQFLGQSGKRVYRNSLAQAMLFNPKPLAKAKDYPAFLF